MGVSFEIKGVKESLDALEQIALEIGDKKATSKFLIPAVKQSLVPVLNRARGSAPRETGLLASSLHIVARRPTSKDKRSIYINQQDTVVGFVSTKAIRAKVKKEFERTHAGLLLDYKNAKKGSDFYSIVKTKVNKAKRDFYASNQVAYDARAIAMEFGTKNVAAKPYLRSALESNSRQVAALFAKLLDDRIQKYRSKT